MICGFFCSSKYLGVVVLIDQERPLVVQATQLEAPVQIQSDSSASMVWGDPQRTLFRLSLKMAEVRLDLNYEDASDCHLASGIFQNFSFNLDVHPASIQLNSALGNVKVFDGTLPVGHPYHQMCGLRADTNASLIEVEFASHTTAESILEDRVPTGSPYYSLKTVISAVDVVIFYRFLNELLVYMSGMLLSLIWGWLHAKALWLCRQKLCQHIYHESCHVRQVLIVNSVTCSPNFCNPSLHVMH